MYTEEGGRVGSVESPLSARLEGGRATFLPPVEASFFSRVL